MLSNNRQSLQAQTWRRVEIHPAIWARPARTVLHVQRNPPAVCQGRQVRPRLRPPTTCNAERPPAIYPGRQAAQATIRNCLSKPRNEHSGVSNARFCCNRHTARPALPRRSGAGSPRHVAPAQRPAGGSGRPPEDGGVTGEGLASRWGGERCPAARPLAGKTTRLATVGSSCSFT